MRGAAIASWVLAFEMTASTALAAAWPDCDPPPPDPSARADYCLDLAAADKAIAEERWDDAIAMLGALSTRKIDEQTPNYRPLLLLGIAHCGKGDRSTGIRYLSLYACALRIDHGAWSCWVDSDPAKGLRSDLPQTCIAIACGEAYSRLDPSGLPPLIREFDEVRRRCD